MKPSEFKKLIKEEIHSALNEEKKYLNDMSYEELIAHRKRMDFKKASREEKKYVKDLIDKKKPLDEVNELEADPTGEFQRRKEKFISPLRKSIVKVLDDAFMIAVKNDQSEEELDRSLKTITDIINNILLGTIRNKKKYYRFD